MSPRTPDSPPTQPTTPSDEAFVPYETDYTKVPTTRGNLLVPTGEMGIDEKPESAAEAKRMLEERVNALQALRAEQREKRAADFAERYGIRDVRDALLAAETRYIEALKEYGEEVPSDIKEAYDQARHEWRAKLRTVVATAEGQDKIAARMIGFRDTVVRVERARQEVLEEKLEQENPGMLDRSIRWIQNPPQLVKGVLVVGKGYARASEFVGKYSGMEKIFGKRGGRVIGSAALVSLAFFATGGVSVVTQLSAFTLRAARGLVGVTVGSAAGVTAGKVVAATYGAHVENRNQRAQSALLEHLREGSAIGIMSEAQLADQEALYREGNMAAREKRRMKAEKVRIGVEIGVTIAVTGSSAISSGYFINEELLEKIPGVSRIVEEVAPPADPSETLEPTSAPSEAGTSQTESIPSSTSAPETMTTPVEAPAPEVSNASPESAVAESATNSSQEGIALPDMKHEIAVGEGTDKAFRALKAEIPESQLQNASPALKYFLTTHENTISRAIGEAYGERGMITQPGDQFYFDENQNLYFKPVSGEAQIFLENDPKAEGGFRIHELKGQPLAPIPQASVPELETTEVPTAPQQMVPEVSPVESAPAVPDAPAATFEAPAGHTLGDWINEPLVPPSSPSPEASSVQAPAESSTFSSEPVAPAPIETMQPGGRTLKEFLDQTHTESGASWPPAEPTMFSMPEKNTFFAYADSPEESLRLAQEYGREHPGVKIYFDNSKFDSLRGDTHQIGSIVFDKGLVKQFNPVEVNQDGQPIESINPRDLRLA